MEAIRSGSASVDRKVKAFQAQRQTAAKQKYRDCLALPVELTPADQAVRDLVDSIYRDFVSPAVRLSTSGENFVDRVAESWGDYMERRYALLTHLSITKNSAHSAMLEQRRAPLQAQLEGYVLSLAGDPARQSLEFAAATAARAHRLGVRIDAMQVDVDLNKDRELCNDFHSGLGLYEHCACCLWAIKCGARYHSTEVLDVIFALLTAGAVDAYGAARNALRLREGSEAAAETAVSVPMDEEDRLLLNEHVVDASELIDKSERDA